MSEVEIQLKAPFTSMVIGPTGSGKTHFVFKLLKSAKDICSVAPERIIYCYGAWQPLFEQYVDEMNFKDGLIDASDVPNDGKHTIMVIDDLMTELAKSKEAVDLFTKHSHHKNISCIFIVQKMFGSTPEMRAVSANSHHMFVFKNPRDASSITHLAKQMFPGNVRFLQEAYEDATKKPYTHLMLNMHQSTPANARVIGNFLSDDPSIPPTCNIPKNKK